MAHLDVKLGYQKRPGLSSALATAKEADVWKRKATALHLAANYGGSLEAKPWATFVHYISFAGSQVLGQSHATHGSCFFVVRNLLCNTRYQKKIVVGANSQPNLARQSKSHDWDIYLVLLDLNANTLARVSRWRCLLKHAKQGPSGLPRCSM